MKKKIGILFSGGIDSTIILIKYLNKNYKIYPIYFKFGYKWEEQELKKSKKIIKFLNKKYNNNINNIKIIDIRNFGEVEQKKVGKTGKDNFIPIRNLTFLTNSRFYLSKINVLTVAHGNLGTDTNSYPDSTKKYFKNIEKLINVGLNIKKFKIKLPLYKKDKIKLTKKYIDSDFPIKDLFSCITPVKNKMCNKCIKCKERIETLKNI